MQIITEKCKGCGICSKDCPVQAIALVDKKASIDQKLCVGCRVCFRVCKFEAVDQTPLSVDARVECDHCPIKCRISSGARGACARYRNAAGVVERVDRPLTWEDVSGIVGPEPADNIRKPVVTAIGAGTSYPDIRPAPAIVGQIRDGVEVVTVATEVPLSYSSIMVKIDTDINIGEQGAPIVFEGREVGMLETEQYGSKMLHIGGVNRLTGGAAGFAAARAVAEIANRRPLKLRIKNGASLEIQVGEPPVIDGVKVGKMRVGCGSATTGIFANMFVEAADEVLVLDSHITGQLSRHVAGVVAGARPSGVEVVFPMSTPGRYFGDHGEGWGGTSITDPKTLIKSVDMKVARPGMTILVTETTGQNGAMLEVQADGSLKDVPLTPKAEEALQAVRDTAEPSLVSAMYSAGSGGSARAGVARYPIKLTRAVHEARVSVTVGGAPAYVMPGGGISFLVDVSRVKPGAFCWTPTPATICPLEYTMTLADYKAMGGHVEAMKPFAANDPRGAGSASAGTWSELRDKFDKK